MGEQTNGFMSRVGGWFRRAKADQAPPGNEIISAENRGLFRPGTSKRDQAIANLQDGFNTLNDLMTTIKSNLNDQGKRQDELLKYLAHLPAAIEGIPETNRLQVESLKAISARLDQQNNQQNLIGEILGKLADNDAQQKQSMDDVRARVDTIGAQNKDIAENLSGVGTAMQTVSKTAQASASVLEQVRDNIDRRDGQLERILHKQASRFTSLLIVAIFLSVAALVAVLVLGWWLLNHPSGIPQQTMVPGTHASP
jgi:archaellum component FlaC